MSAELRIAELVEGQGSPGAPQGGVLTVQGVAGATPIQVAVVENPRQLAQGQIGTIETILYTVPAGKKAVIRTISICNTSTSDRTVRFCLVPSGGVFGSSTALLWDLTVRARTSVQDDGIHILETGGSVRATADGANALTCTIDGAEV